MVPVSISTLYVTPTVSLPLFTITGYTSSPTILANSLPVVPTASPRTLLTITSVSAADIPELSHSIITATTSNNSEISSQLVASFDGSKWWNKRWVPVAAWALIIYDAASLFLLLWLWSIGMMDAMLNVSPSHLLSSCDSLFTSALSNRIFVWFQLQLTPRPPQLIRAPYPSGTWAWRPSRQPSTQRWNFNASPDRYPHYPSDRAALLRNDYDHNPVQTAQIDRADQLHRPQEGGDHVRRNQVLAAEFRRLGII